MFTESYAGKDGEGGSGAAVLGGRVQGSAK
jgi:hypothetical protein